MVASALIGAAGSILGGLFGSSKPKYVVPNYAGIRKKAEAAGFNPLTALAMAPGQAFQGQNYMGSALADAGLMLADAMAKKSDGGKLEQAERENASLRDKVQSLTLRPQVGGIYAQRQAVPTMAQALGVQDASSPADLVQPVSAGELPVRVSGGDAPPTVGPAPLLTVDTLDPRREVKNEPVVTYTGYIVIDNPAAGAPWRVPAVQGEILDLGQTMVMGGAYAFDRSERLNPSNGGGLTTAERQLQREYAERGKSYLRERDARRNPYPLSPPKASKLGFWDFYSPASPW